MNKSHLYKIYYLDYDFCKPIEKGSYTYDLKNAFESSYTTTGFSIREALKTFEENVDCLSYEVRTITKITS